MSDFVANELSAGKVCLCHSEAPPQMDVAALELGFFPKASSLWFKRFPDHLLAKSLPFLTHRVTCNSKDLVVHVHRVVAHYHAGCSDGLYGALLDLYITLGSKGFALRKRMYEKFAPYLKSEHRAALRKGLQSGLKAEDNVPDSHVSRFKHPNLGNTYLIEKKGDDVVRVDFDALDEARDLIDSGFIDEARMLLEEILTSQPECEETNKELLDIYKYTKNKEAFFATRERFNGLTLALDDAWEELAEKFMTEEERVSDE
ncbi:FimV family protein [Pseudomonadota bacterium]